MTDSFLHTEDVGAGGLGSFVFCLNQSIEETFKEICLSRKANFPGSHVSHHMYNLPGLPRALFRMVWVHQQVSKRQQGHV